MERLPLLAAILQAFWKLWGRRVIGESGLIAVRDKVSRNPALPGRASGQGWICQTLNLYGRHDRKRGFSGIRVAAQTRLLVTLVC